MKECGNEIWWWKNVLCLFWNIPSLIFILICSSIKSFPSLIPQFTQNTSLSLIVDEHTNLHFPHSYLSYKSTTIHVLTWIQITPQLLILLFQTTHSVSLSLKTIISLVNPQNQFLLPFFLIRLIDFKNVIESMTFPYSSSITHHTPSFLSLMMSESSQVSWCCVIWIERWNKFIPSSLSTHLCVW